MKRTLKKHKYGFLLTVCCIIAIYLSCIITKHDNLTKFKKNISNITKNVKINKKDIK